MADILTLPRTPLILDPSSQVFSRMESLHFSLLMVSDGYKEMRSKQSLSCCPFKRTLGPVTFRQLNQIAFIKEKEEKERKERLTPILPHGHSAIKLHFYYIHSNHLSMWSYSYYSSITFCSLSQIELFVSVSAQLL